MSPFITAAKHFFETLHDDIETFADELISKVTDHKQPEAEQTQKTGEDYVVKPGDSLSRIAEKKGIAQQKILQDNPAVTNPNKIYVGQHLKLAGGKTTSHSEKTVSHTVKDGDSLSKIAKQHGTTVGDIMRANPGKIARQDLIFPGQKLRIPVGTTSKENHAAHQPATKTPVLKQPAVETKPKVEPQSTTTTGKTSPYLKLKSDNIKMSPLVREKMSRIADEYHQRTGKSITITDANRTPLDQADRMYVKIRAGGEDIYANKTALAEVKAAYNKGKALGESPTQIKERMGKVIQEQTERGVYISRHLVGQGADVRISDMLPSDRKAFLESVAKVGGVTKLNEGDHWHLQVDPKSTTTPTQTAPVQTNPAVNTTPNQTVVNSNLKIARIDLDEYLSPKKGSNAGYAILIGIAEGNRTANGDKTTSYYGHRDPGDGKWNIGSFSYSNERGGTQASSPEDADRIQLTRLYKSKDAYVAAMNKAGLDPNNALVATAYLDMYNQSPSSAAILLKPENLKYLKDNGTTVETMKEWRYRGFFNPETGTQQVNSRGRLAGGNLASGDLNDGYAGMANRTAMKKYGRLATPDELKALIHRDQNRRVDAMIEPMKNAGMLKIDNSQANPKPKIIDGLSNENPVTVKPVIVKPTVIKPAVTTPISSANNSKVNVLLPKEGKGYVTFNNDGNDHFGTALTIENLQKIGQLWNAKYPDLPIQIGDMSHEGGGKFSPHGSHRTGIDIDIRPIRKDGQLDRLDISETPSQLDRDKVRELIGIIRQVNPKATILFNDKTLIGEKLTTYWKGHNNHLHVRFKY